MPRPRILITRRLPEEGLAVLRPACELIVGPEEQPLPRDALLRDVRDCEGLLVVSHTRVDGEFMDAAPRLLVIANFGVGVDHIDVAAATARGIYVTNTAGSLTETTAELGWSLILAAARRIAEGDRFVRAGLWKGTGPFVFLGMELVGKTLGIVGAGRIGQAVARRAHAFQMARILYWSRAPKPEFETATGAERRDLDALLRESDVVVLTVTLSPETRRMIGKRELALMKRSAYLVNIARGPIVDEAALAEALREGRLAGAGLDVYEKEPEIHPDLLKCESAVLVPHIGSATVETRTRMAVLAAENCLAGVQGRVPTQALNAGEIRQKDPRT